MAMSRMSVVVDTVARIWTGVSRPVRIGPITVAPAISCVRLTDIDAEWRAGKTTWSGRWPGQSGG